MSSVREFLNETEQRLVSQVAELRERLIPLENELADVRKAKSALGLGDLSETQGASSVQETPLVTEPENNEAGFPFRHMTMKELILKALAERFPTGTTTAGLVDFFASAWDRKDVARASLSPQLSRLKNEGKVELHGQLWRLPTEEENNPPLVLSDAQPSPSGERPGLFEKRQSSRLRLLATEPEEAVAEKIETSPDKSDEVPEHAFGSG